MKQLMEEMTIGLKATLALSLVLCGIYPLLTLVIGQAFFPFQANGSLLNNRGSLTGSELIAQSFSSARYFHSRPSAAGSGYDALHSGGSNLGSTSRQLTETVQARIEHYRRENGLAAGTLIPADAVMASGSGLDPHISLRNACLQAARVAQSRGLNKDAVLELIHTMAEGRTLWVLGEPRVNVLRLNMKLDQAL